MDPVAHTLTGAALAASGLRRTTPLATAALLISANAPDVDALSYFAGPFASVSFRRGWTHGLPVLSVLPFVVTGLLLLWDRRVRRRRQPGAQPARAGPLLVLAVLAVATHPTLDWLNNYGMRWLAPFDGRWFYGDAVFIIDPWIWLVLGSVLFLMHSRRASSLAVWAVFWLSASVLLLATPSIPLPSRVLWVAGVAAAFAARALGFAAPGRELALERATHVALGIVALYIAAAVFADTAERRVVLDDLAARGIGPVEALMVAPVPANPFAGDVVAATAEAYYVGQWRWLGRPRFELAADRIRRLPRDVVVEAAARTPEARRFLIWARFPYFEVESSAEGYVVRVLDARYHGTGGLGSPVVRLDRNLDPLPAD